MRKELFSINNYGKIYLDVETLMKEQGFTTNSLSKAIGSNFDVIKRWSGKDMRKLDTDVLARICYVLDCDPGDILKITH